MLETLDDPANVMTELRRVTKHGGVVGAASVDYGGLILGGDQTAGPRRFYDIREQVWRAMGSPSRIWVAGCAGFFKKLGSGVLKRLLTT
jgi:hypothetical protein